MATNTELRRRGLPRRPGGEPWPAEGRLPGEAAAADAPEAVSIPEVVVASEARHSAPDQDLAPAEVAAAAPESAAVASFRSGLPRVRGGEPWPPGGARAGAAAVGGAEPAQTPRAAHAAPVTAEAVSAEAVPAEAVPTEAAPAAAEMTAPAEQAAPDGDGVPLRRGLPRVRGGEPWPAAGFAPASAKRVRPEVAAVIPEAADPAPVDPAPGDPAPADPAPAEAVPASVEPIPAPTPVDPAPAPAEPTPAPAPKPTPPPTPRREPKLIAGKPLSRWVRWAVLGLLGLVAAAGIIVLAARGVTTLPGVPEFVERYPGEYHLPEFVAEGFPAWARWTHFLNFFFMVLIIRTGLLVRHQQKPPAYYTPKRGGKKVSIFLWLHTSLDVLWLLNGVVFVVLLFATGHWARIVPTSWEVFPNAVSAMLQYLTLEWPVENGWVNYNSLQQLMYFTVVFIAAPLAAITGVRMSSWWPEDAERLNRAYPAPLARAVHFPVMLFFTAFILVHVFLVFATGMRRNLNHMFAGSDETSWLGFWLLVVGLAVTAGAWFAARPLILAPIASVSGRVSER